MILFRCLLNVKQRGVYDFELGIKAFSANRV